MRVKRFGRVADIGDQRDLSFKAARPQDIALPVSLDLRANVAEIYDQDQLGSCTGHGSVGAFRMLLKKENLKDWRGSRLAAYYYARSFEGTISYDAGAQIRDAMKGLHQYGALDEKLWPYTEKKFAKAPNATAIKSGLKHLGVSYQSVDNKSWDELRKALVTEWNLVIGITCYESFESDSVANNGRVPMPGRKEAVVGGHCMHAVGYTADALICANSWGTGWGEKGFCYLPKAYVTNPKLASDFWTWTKI